MTIFVHPSGLCESKSVGPGTRVWAFAHVLPGAQIGRDCNICDHVFVENDVIIGDRVTIKCGVQLWDGLRVGSDVFLGPNVTLTNDKFPRSKQYQESVRQTFIADGVSVGANSTILPGLKIGQHAMVGAGSVVTRDVPPNAIVVGNPARIVGYVNAASQTVIEVDSSPSDSAVSLLAVTNVLGGVTLHRLKVVTDLRGSLSVAQFGKEVPFTPKRYFVVYDVPSKYVRGEHAHRHCKQFLVCQRGCVSVVVDDGTDRKEIVLDGPNLGLYLPPMVWATQYKYTSEAVMLVFASEPYDSEDYIRDYDEFLSLVEGGLAAR